MFGVAGSMILWGASAAIGMLQAWIYSEPATMFGHRSGGIALYAHEGWRKYTTLVGPLSAFGYWIGWSVVLSIFGKIIGDLATSQWWPHSGLSIAFAGNTLTLSSFIAIGCIIFVWAFNIFGLKAAVWFTYACAALLMVPIVLFVVVPYFTGKWHGANVHAVFPGPWGGVKLAIVYMFILAWSAYGTEACATFAPEYRSIQDTHRALRSSADVHAARLPAGAARAGRRPGRLQGRRDRRRGPVLHERDVARSSVTARPRSSRSASSPSCCCR